MKKYILALTAAATLLGACEVDDKYYGKEVVDPAEKLEPAYGEDWTAHADKIDEKLIENFMNTDRGTFWYTDQDRTNESTYCYWPQAHAMDVLIDAYLRIPEGDARRDTYAGYMSKWYENKGNNYGNSYWGTYGFGNAYTDDSEWIILTLIRMYEATGVQKYLDAARKTYEETVIARWTDDENGGGIRWSFDAENSKNACSNGPGALCAMRLWANSPEGAERDQYLADAKKIYNWLSSTLYNPLTGAVSDNMKNGVINGGALTYNQGTFMGAAHELYKATGDESYLKDAQRTAAACYDYFFEEFTPADGEAFRIIRKGNVWFSAVMVRGLVELYGIDGNAAYVDAVQRSLDYAWDHARDGRGLFETDFTGADKQAEKWLLTQGAMAEMYGRMSGVGLK